MTSKEQAKEPTLKDFLGNIVPVLPNDAIDYMHQRVSQFMPALGMPADFRLRLVIDTNVLFQAVRGKMLEGSCFLEKIIRNPKLELCAPLKITDEIMQKIACKFPAEKKTQHLVVEECQALAASLLSHINLRDDIDLDSLEYAESRLKSRDEDDVPFFALSLSCLSHGAITNDKDLKELDELPTWTLGETGKMLMVINRGTLAMFLTHDVLSLLFRGLFETVCALWLAFVKVAKVIGCLIGSGIKKGYEIVSDCHPLVQLLGALIAIKIEIKHQPLQKLGKHVLGFLDALFIALKPILEVLASILGYLTTTFVDLMLCSIESVRQIESLPIAKKKPQPPFSFA